MRFADAVTAIWHGRVEIDRFNELVLRAGLTWQQVTVLRSYAKYLRQAGFPYSQSHIETVVNDNAGDGARARRTLRGAVRSGGRAVGVRARSATRRRRPPRSPPASTHWSASTPTGCCGRSRR